MKIEHSRSLLLGTQVSGADERTLLQRQEDALATVRIDPNIPGAVLTARVLLTTLRRLPGQLTLDGTGLDDALVAELVAAVAAVDSSRPLAVVEGAPETAAVRIDIALQEERGYVRVVPDGYGAQLANDPNIELDIGQPANALGAVFAAALAAAEAFKRIVVDKEDRRTFQDHFRFCPVTLSTDTTIAPALRAEPLDLAVIGNGAIGTATVLILKELQLGGRIVLCDPETFEPENRGTYSIGGEKEAIDNPLKVKLAASALDAAGYDTVQVPATSRDLIASVDQGEIAAPRVVLTGLDSAEARRETQMLFPDHTIDAATGDTGVGLHHAVPDGPCLRCFFPELQQGPDPIVALARETGLPVSRLKRGDDALTEEDLAALTPDQRDRLKDFIGRPVCGLADALDLTGSETEGYRPSVPFVSQMAACLAVGRLAAVSLGLHTAINLFHFDALHTYMGEGEIRNAVDDCFCQQRPRIVQRVREQRWPTRRAA